MKLYPSIPHLPGSRASGDHVLPIAQARRFIDASRVRPPREKDDVVIVEEKLDGSCVAVVREGDVLVAFGREGRRAESSRNVGRRKFAAWVAENANRLAKIIAPNEMLVGEWMALVHGIEYELPHELFVLFDVFCNQMRAPRRVVRERAALAKLPMPGLVHEGTPITIADALSKLGRGFSGAIEAPEGLVYRIERKDKVIDVAKWVRADKIDGEKLPEKTGEPARWNRTR